MTYLAQIIGFIALILLLAVFQREKRSHMFIFKIFSSVFYCIHFALLGAWTGSAMNLVATLRNYVFKQRTEKRWADKMIWLFVFLLIIIVSGIFTWEGYHSILPMIATSIYTITFWMKEPKANSAIIFNWPSFLVNL